MTTELFLSSRDVERSSARRGGSHAVFNHRIHRHHRHHTRGASQDDTTRQHPIHTNMITYKRKEHKLHTLGNNSDRRRWTTMSEFRFFSLNFLAACSFLWIMTFRSSYFFHLSSAAYSRMTAIEDADRIHTVLRGKLTVGSSLESFKNFPHATNATKTTAASRSPQNDTLLATMNLPQWMKGKTKSISLISLHSSMI